MTLIQKANYSPKYQASCSSIKLGNTCERAYVYRYFFGLDEEEAKTWAEAKRLVKPAAAPKYSSPDVVLAQKENVKLYNRTRRKALGKAGHGVLERWAHNKKKARDAQYVPAQNPGERAEKYARRLDELAEPIDWYDQPGRIVSVGLGNIPNPDLCYDFHVERPLARDFVQQVTEGRLNYEFNGYLDLESRHDNRELFDAFGQRSVITTDYKTTSSFDWIKTVEELQRDEQAIVYPLDTMLALSISHVCANWVYFLTEGSPKSRAVRFDVEYHSAMRRAQPVVERGAELIQLLRSAPKKADDVTPNIAACTLYGGCIYHEDRGGPCTARVSMGKILRAKTARTKTEEEAVIMAFKNQGGAAAAVRNAVAPARAARPQPQTQSEPAEGEEVPPEEEAAPAEQPAPAARRGRPPGGGRAAAPAQDTGSIYLRFEGLENEIEVPKGSPLYAQALAIYTAFFPS